MGRPNSTIRKWLKEATPDQAKKLAKLAQTSVPYLRHVAAGRRELSADLAQRLATASHQFDPSLYLQQAEICRACGRCPLVAVLTQP